MGDSNSQWNWNGDDDCLSTVNCDDSDFWQQEDECLSNVTCNESDFWQQDDCYDPCTEDTYYESARAFLFIVVDELSPSGKIVRKVQIPSANVVKDLMKKPIETIKNSMHGHQYERYGMRPPDPYAMKTVGEHVFGDNQSQFLSASTLPEGAPKIDGKPQWIDIKKLKAAGSTIHTTEEIVTDLRRLMKVNPQWKNLYEKLINTVTKSEGEVLIEGKVPPHAIKSAKTMEVTRKVGKYVRVVNVVGVVFTAYDIGKASKKSVDQKSYKPIAAETIRQVGGWGGALAGMKIGGAGGVAVGAVSGPGAVITGAVGGLIGGVLGYLGADWVADQIDEN